jgi:hypothetical protein
MKWKYFCGACLVVGGALFKVGAPLFAIIAGIALAVIMNILRHRGQTAPRHIRTGKRMAQVR